MKQLVSLWRWLSQPITKSTTHWYAFAVLTLIYFGYLRAFGDWKLWHDSGHYFRAATSASLDDYKVAFRGYSFPFLCYGLRQLASWMRIEVANVYWMFSSMLFAWLGTIAAPNLAKHELDCAPPSVLSLISFNLLVFVFFRGYLNHPLTDFPSLISLLTCLWLLVATERSFLSGALLALAVNFRPVYAIAALPVGLLVLQRTFLVWRERSWFRSVAHVGAFALGLCLVLGPQVYVNHHNFNRISVMPPTDIAFGKSLYSAQIQVGVQSQKYETNVGPDVPRASIVFGDPSGMALLASNPVRTDNDLFQLILRQPFKFVAIYARHLFNGLDVKYPDVYIEHFANPSWILSFLNYTVLFRFLEFLRGRWCVSGNSLTRLLVLLSILAPVVAVIPSVVEVRFFLPLHVLIYAVVAFAGLSWNRLPRPGQFVRFALFIGACFALSDNAYQFLQ